MTQMAVPVNPRMFEGEKVRMLSLIGERKYLLELRELVEERLLKELEEAFEEALNGPIRRILNSPSLSVDFPLEVYSFLSVVAKPLNQFSVYSLNKVSSNEKAYGEFNKLFKELYNNLAKELRATGYENIEDLVYAMSIVFDHDLWVINKVHDMGIEAFTNKLIERAPRELYETSGYYMYLLFSLFSSMAAVLNLVDTYKKENLSTLIFWAKSYADELDLYLDTLDLFLSDETYEELVSEGIIKL